MKQDTRDGKRTFGQVPLDGLRRLAESGRVSARGVSQYAADVERIKMALRWLWNELDDIREAREAIQAKDRFHRVMGVHPIGLGLHTRTIGDIRRKQPT